MFENTHNVEVWSWVLALWVVPHVIGNLQTVAAQVALWVMEAPGHETEEWLEKHYWSSVLKRSVLLLALATMFISVCF